MDTVLISIGPLLAIVAVVVGRLRGRRPVASLVLVSFLMAWHLYVARSLTTWFAGVRQALVFRIKVLPARHLGIASAMAALGDHLFRQSRYTDAPALEVRGHEGQPGGAGEPQARGPRAHPALL